MCKASLLLHFSSCDGDGDGDGDDDDDDDDDYTNKPFAQIG